MSRDTQLYEVSYVLQRIEYFENSKRIKSVTDVARGDVIVSATGMNAARNQVLTNYKGQFHIGITGIYGVKNK